MFNIFIQFNLLWFRLWNSAHFKLFHRHNWWWFFSRSLNCLHYFVFELLRPNTRDLIIIIRVLNECYLSYVIFNLWLNLLLLNLLTFNIFSKRFSNIRYLVLKLFNCLFVFLFMITIINKLIAPKIFTMFA